MRTMLFPNPSSNLPLLLALNSRHHNAMPRAWNRFAVRSAVAIFVPGYAGSRSRKYCRRTWRRMTTPLPPNYQQSVPQQGYGDACTPSPLLDASNLMSSTTGGGYGSGQPLFDVEHIIRNAVGPVLVTLVTAGFEKLSIRLNTTLLSSWNRQGQDLLTCTT